MFEYNIEVHLKINAKSIIFVKFLKVIFFLNSHLNQIFLWLGT